MPLPDLAEKWSSKVMKVTIGATKAEGGTRERAITVGGSACIPFMDFEGDKGCRPVIAMDVLNIVPEWPEALKEPFRDVLGDPGKWAAKCVKEYGADLICLKLDGIHPDKGNKSADVAERGL
jgi:acetyl-CoA decarbonylase/synthase complex subunit delta